jgi:hypothetical protein
MRFESDLKLEIELAGRVLEAGGKVPIALLITNVGATVLEFCQLDSVPTIWFADSDRKWKWPSQIGALVSDNPCPESISLAPGERHSYSAELAVYAPEDVTPATVNASLRFVEPISGEVFLLRATPVSVEVIRRAA